MASSSQYTAIASFPMFQRLAEELRCTIWKFSCFETRNISVSVEPALILPHEDKYDAKMGYESYGIYQYITRSSLPAVLHATSESRREALRYYELSFGMEWTSPRISPLRAAPAQTYINWQADNVCFVYPMDMCMKLKVLSDNFKTLCISKGLRRIAFRYSISIAERCNTHSYDYRQELLDLVFYECANLAAPPVVEYRTAMDRVSSFLRPQNRPSNPIHHNSMVIKPIFGSEEDNARNSLRQFQREGGLRALEIRDPHLNSLVSHFTQIRRARNNN